MARKYNYDIEGESARLDKGIERAENTERLVKSVVTVFLVIGIIFVALALLDLLKFTNDGMGNMKYHDFDELLKINPDTVGWLTVDDTHIDHPVVQGKDNFEYLDKNFYGKFYAGGSLFLDYQNNRQFKDSYNIIHGHHMAGGAMFGDLGNFLQREYFDTHRTGKLLTPTYDYDLEVIGVAEANAYDDNVYSVKLDKDTVWEYVQRKCTFTREANLSDGQLLALSTCSGEMNDNRTVVFCKMKNKVKHQ